MKHSSAGFQHRLRSRYLAGHDGNGVVRLADVGEIAGIVAAAVVSATTTVAVMRWAWSRWRKHRSRCAVPVGIRFQDAIHYGPMSGIWISAPANSSKSSDPGAHLQELKQRGDISYLEYTPFSLWISNTSKRKRDVIHLREIWLSLEEFRSLDLVREQQPLAVNVSTVAAGGRGPDLSLGGTFCTTEPTKVPLLASSAAKDRLGSFDIRLQGGDEFEIELELAATEPGRYLVQVCLELDRAGKTHVEEIDTPIALLACPNLEWATGFAHSFAWQSLNETAACDGGSFPTDWRDWRSRWEPPERNARFFVPFHHER